MEKVSTFIVSTGGGMESVKYSGSWANKFIREITRKKNNKTQGHDLKYNFYILILYGFSFNSSKNRSFLKSISGIRAKLIKNSNSK
ncbi:hypothetical protein ES705_25063 [subsurface metagenome]